MKTLTNVFVLFILGVCFTTFAQSVKMSKNFQKGIVTHLLGNASQVSRAPAVLKGKRG